MTFSDPRRRLRCNLLCFSICALLLFCHPLSAVAQESVANPAKLPKVTQLHATRQIARVVNRLPVEEQARLQKLQRRFDKLPASDQAKLRQLHDSLWQDDDAGRLYRLLQQYRDWLSLLSPGQRDDVLSLPAGERVAAIARIKQDQDAQRFAEQSSALRESDGATVARWLVGFVESRDEEIQASLPERAKQHLGRIDNPKRRVRLMMPVLVKEGLWRNLTPPSRDELDQLVEQLSPSARARLQQVTTGPEQMELVTEWIRTSFLNRFRSIQITDAELNDFYTHELTPDEQEEVDRLPADQVHAELRRIFLERRRHHPPEGRNGTNGPRGPKRRSPRGWRPEGPGGDDRRRDRPPLEGPPPEGFGPPHRRPSESQPL